MKYRDYVRLIKPECVGNDFGAGVFGCRTNYGLKKPEDCGTEEGDNERICIKCWDQEIPGKVVATAKQDGCAFGLSSKRFFRGQKYDVLGVSDSGNPKIKAEGWGSKLNCDRNFFTFRIEQEEEKAEDLEEGVVYLGDWMVVELTSGERLVVCGDKLLGRQCMFFMDELDQDESVRIKRIYRKSDIAHGILDLIRKPGEMIYERHRTVTRKEAEEIILKKTGEIVEIKE